MGFARSFCNTNAKLAIKLKNYDYSSPGAYFVTICIRDRMNILSEIVKTDLMATDKTTGLAVGEGLAPPEITVKLKPCGEVVKEQLKSLSLWERWRRSRRRGLNCAQITLSPAIAGALPQGEPLGARNLRGVWALPEAFVIQMRNLR